ncbi:cytochrome P450 [Melanogaster broomeanus]|nr:cytochrome P450 [Melanogaster broomeanus]
MIIVNSEKVAKILLDRRSNLYSDRPHLAPTAPFSAAIIMSLIYDYEISPGKDHFVELFERGARIAIEALLPESASIIATFPFVLSLPIWFPGAVFSRRAALSKKCANEMLSAPFEYVRKREADGAPSSAMVPNFLRSEKHTGDPSATELIKEVAAAGFIGERWLCPFNDRTFTPSTPVGGSETNPEVQKRAQAEIDDVVGMDRLPNFDDRPSLPYVEAVLRETMRMYPIVPLVLVFATVKRSHTQRIFGRTQRMVCSIVRHITTQAFMFAVTRAMLRDPETYPEPNSFKPERFFKDGKLDDEPSTSNIGYGFGRRICPGRYTADASIWAGLVTFLSTMTISKALDAEGREIEVDPKFTTGAASCPLPFPCAIVPRRAGLDAEMFSRQMKDVTKECV